MQKWLILLGILSATASAAQHKFIQKQRFLEAGVLFGATNYSGDLAEKIIQLSETQTGYGAFVRYFYGSRFALRGELLSGSVSGDDSNAKSLDLRQRSCRFGADILELSMIGEWYPLGLYRFKDVGVHQFFVAPYLYLGFGCAFSGSKVDYYGDPAEMDKYLVAPLPEFNPQQQFLLVPAGFGARLRLNEVLALGLEAGARPVFSDKLDGVSLNGNPKKKDWYYFAGASIAFVLSRSKKRI